VFTDTLQNRVGIATEPDRRVGLAGGARAEQCRRDIKKFTLELKAVIGPQTFHDLDALHGVGPATIKTAAGDFDLKLAGAASTQPQGKAPATITIKGSHLLGDIDRMLHRHDQHASRHFDCFGQCQSTGSANQRVLIEWDTKMGRFHRLVQGAHRMVPVGHPLKPALFRYLTHCAHVHIGDRVTRIAKGSAETNFHRLISSSMQRRRPGAMGQLARPEGNPPARHVVMV